MTGKKSKQISVQQTRAFDDNIFSRCWYCDGIVEFNTPFPNNFQPFSVVKFCMRFPVELWLMSTQLPFAPVSLHENPSQPGTVLHLKTTIRFMWNLLHFSFHWKSSSLHTLCGRWPDEKSDLKTKNLQEVKNIIVHLKEQSSPEVAVVVIKTDPLINDMYLYMFSFPRDEEIIWMLRNSTNCTNVIRSILYLGFPAK